MRTLVSRAVMQLLSLGQRPLREELDACDASPQSGERGFAVLGHLVDGLDDQADPLLLAQAQVAIGLQDAPAVDRFGVLSHGRGPVPNVRRRPLEGKDPRFAFERQVRSWQAIFFSGRMP